MMNVDQCRMKAADALKAAAAASGPELRAAWRAVADEWDMIGAVAELHLTLTRPRAIVGLH